ncbi:SBBP repeat-containing protein [Thermodesulfobacteriota bacterium]
MKKIKSGNSLFFSMILLLITSACEPRPAWVALYDGSEEWHDVALAVAVDGQGNVYVTGETFGADTNRDYTTVKYDSDGSELWVARYDGPDHHGDRVKALAVDDDGNVYVTGMSDARGHPEYSYDYATVKYDRDGNECWAARYNGPADESDHAWALAADDHGNVYVTGSSYGVGTGVDCATIKYDADGNEAWVARYNGPDNDHEGAYAVAVDDNGFVYVTGGTMQTMQDFLTIKYDPEGNLLWKACYDSPYHGSDFAHSLAVDDSGNVLVTGNSDGLEYGEYGFERDFATVKYDSDGNRLWARRFNGIAFTPSGLDNARDQVYEVVVDHAGNVYVTGASVAWSVYWYEIVVGYVTIKYDPDGNRLWKVRKPGAFSYRVTDPEFPDAHVALDDQGNLYWAGVVDIPNGSGAPATIKYDPDGNKLWETYRFQGGLVSDLTLDDAGNIYTTGTDNDCFATVKYVQ